MTGLVQSMYSKRKRIFSTYTLMICSSVLFISNTPTSKYWNNMCVNNSQNNINLNCEYGSIVNDVNNFDDSIINNFHG